MLKVHQVTKSFGRTTALQSISLSVDAGIHCLVGRNGAGKTTLLRSAVGLIEPDSGSVRVFDRNPRHYPEVMNDVGVVFDRDLLFDFLTPEEFLVYCAALYGVDHNEGRERSRELLDEFQIPADACFCHQLSSGNRRRLAVAVALIHGPRLLILDEPFRGLDPEGLAHLTVLLRRFSDAGSAVLLSSHRLDVVEELADSVSIIERGKLSLSVTGDGVRELRTSSELHDHFAFESEADGESRRLGWLTSSGDRH